MRLNVRSRVVLPEPLSPINATHCPVGTSSVTRSSARVSPYRFETSTARSAATESGGGSGAGLGGATPGSWAAAVVRADIAAGRPSDERVAAAKLGGSRSVLLASHAIV